ncbi:MAG: hypothetical protein ABIZ57_08655, partial [Candidatus Limnocylindria bacterium]
MAIESDEIRAATDELLDAGAHDRLDTMRHSTAHVMAAAVLELFPEAKLGIGPAIRDGFYYDFDLPRTLTPSDLEAIEERMRAQVAAKLPFERSDVLKMSIDSGQFIGFMPVTWSASSKMNMLSWYSAQWPDVSHSSLRTRAGVRTSTKPPSRRTCSD